MFWVEEWEIVEIRQVGYVESIKLMNKFAKAIAAISIVVSVGVLAYALLTPTDTSDTTDHMGMGLHMSYNASNVGLISASIVVIIVSLMVVLLWDDYVPLKPEEAFPPPSVPSAEAPATAPTPSPVLPRLDAEDAPAHNYLVLRLLTGDERTMFKMIMDSGGDALQKDLIAKSHMSNAKVSRVLSRLEEKGVVTKDRHGATNKIRIKLDS